MKKLATIGFIIMITFFLFINMGLKSILAEDNSRPAAQQIPNGSIIIGTHIIYFDVLNQENLAAALDSADKNDQPLVYYKSELNNGVWYDITNAQNIVDITLSSDKAVSNKTIDELYLTHWTKPDGTTIEFATGQKTQIHDIDSLLNPLNMGELEEIKIELQMQKGKYTEIKKTDDEDKLKAAKNNIDSINSILELISAEEAADISNKLKSYDDFINYLRTVEKASDDLIGIAIESKDILSIQRDIICYQIVLERLTAGLEVPLLADDAGLLDKYGTAMDKITQKINELQLKVSNSEKSKILEQMFDQYRIKMEEQIVKGGFSAAYQELCKLAAIDNIFAKIIHDKNLEMSILKDARNKLLQVLQETFGQGDSKEYRTARGNGEPTSVLIGIKEATLAGEENRLKEMDEIKEYLLYRHGEDQEQKIAMVQNLLNEYKSIANSLPNDDIHNDAYDLLMAWIEKLNKLLAQLKAGLSPEFAAGTNSLSNLQDAARQLQEDYLSALEQGDLNKAEDLNNQLAAVSDQLANQGLQAQEDYQELLKKKNELEDKLAKSPGGQSALTEELGKIDVQLAITEALLDSKAQAGLADLSKLKAELTKAVKDNDFEAAAGLVDNLSALLNIIPAELMGNEQKAAEFTEMVKVISAKAAQLASMGNGGAAQNLEDLVSKINDAKNKLTEAGAEDDLLNDAGAENAYAEMLNEKSKYSGAELSALNKLVSSMKENYSGINVFPPYYLVFEDWNIKISAPYILIEDEIYIPVRKLSEALGAQVVWRPVNDRVIAQDNYFLLEYTIGSNIAYLNDKQIELERNVENYNGITYLPLKLILDGYNLRADKSYLPTILIYKN